MHGTIASMGLAGDREPTRKMIGELTRDGGMLALVFGLLDALIKTTAGEDHRVEWWWYPCLIGVSLLWIALGVWLERTRRSDG
jgi:hypothetical protein